jgi:flagellar biosynthesis protein FlhG
MTQTRARKIIGIVSGKGGVGKTFISVNLAAALAEAGCRTLVFDADLGLANVDLQLGLDINTSVSDFLMGNCEFAKLIQRAERIGCDVVSGRSALTALTNSTEYERSKLKTALLEAAGSYDYVLIDMPAGIDGNVTDFFDICDALYVVLRADPTSLMDAYALMKVTPSRLRQRVFIIANAVTNSNDARDLAVNFSAVTDKFLSFNPGFLGGVRADRNVEISIRRQLPVYAAAPQSHAAADIRSLARRVLS